MSFFSSPKKAKIGIVMCTKDRPILLQRAIQNVIDQTFSDWFLYVVNDGGDRARLKVVLDSFGSKLEQKFQLIHRAENGGIGRALNTGLKEVHEEFLAIHEDDDTWESTFLAESLLLLEEPSSTAMAGATVCRCHLIKENLVGDLVTEVTREIYNDWQSDFLSFFRNCETLTYPPICLLFRKSVLDQIGGFREDLAVLMDWDFALRLFSFAEVRFLPKVLANYHRRVNVGETDANANTLQAWPKSYGVSDMKIRNDLLREDIQKGRVGLGLMVNLGFMHGHLFSQIQDVKSQLNRIENLLRKN